VSTSHMQSYYLSKWTCPVHGHFSARTVHPVDQNRPVHCPECVSVFEGQVKGTTVLPVPFVTRPTWPKVHGMDRTFSDKAPSKERKQGNERVGRVRFLP
jgi:hypothetical protein